MVDNIKNVFNVILEVLLKVLAAIINPFISLFNSVKDEPIKLTTYSIGLAAIGGLAISQYQFDIQRFITGYRLNGFLFFLTILFGVVSFFISMKVSKGNAFILIFLSFVVTIVVVLNIYYVIIVNNYVITDTLIDNDYSIVYKYKRIAVTIVEVVLYIVGTVNAILVTIANKRNLV